MCRAKVQARTCHFHNNLEGNSNNNDVKYVGNNSKLWINKLSSMTKVKLAYK